MSTLIRSGRPGCGKTSRAARGLGQRDRSFDPGEPEPYHLTARMYQTEGRIGVAKVRDSGMPPATMWESFFDPSGILDAFGCRALQGDAVEFGCGYGTFTAELAARISGTVYALDVEPDMVLATATRAQRAGAHNIVVEQRDFVTAGSGRPDESVACVLLFNILHVEDPVTLLTEAHRIAREGGIVAVIHWRHDIETPRGPPMDIRPTPAQCRVWAERAGLRFQGMRDLPKSRWHWGLLLERRSQDVTRARISGGV